MTAVNDAVAEGLHTSTISHTATSADTDYNGITISDVTASITDNDTAGVTINNLDGSIDATEGGTTDAYTIALTSEPTANVSVAISTDGRTGVSPTTLTFTSANWNTPQSVTVTATDDHVAEGNHNSSITHAATSADTMYNGITIAGLTAHITDNDTAGVSITESGGATNVVEGGTNDSYTIALTSQPLADVTITVDPDDQTSVGGGSGNVVTLTFTSANWQTGQTVNVSATNDSVAEGAHTSTITHSALSTDPAYNGVSINSVTVQITDNDTAGVTIDEVDGAVNVTEGGATDVYKVRLSSQPLADVTVTISADGKSTVNPASLAFTSANWSTPQTVTVTAANDDIAEGTHTSTIGHTTASGDSNYNAISVANVTAHITDNDTAGVTINQVDGSVDVAEGGATDIYKIVLTSEPTANVTVTINTDGKTAVSPTSLTFTNANWATAQTVTVTATDDHVAEGNHTSSITHTASSTDANYNGPTIAGVTAHITDNDTAGVAIDDLDGAINVTEGGTTDTYTIVLNSQPTANVILTLGTDGKTTVSPTSLTFTSGNWSSPQTVTVTAVNDDVVEGAHNSTISCTAASGDSSYSGISVANVTAHVTDNDSVGIVITEEGGSTNVVEGGATDTYTVALHSQPTANVVVTVTPGSQVSVGAGAGTAIQLTFTPATWNSAQTVTVTANDDHFAEGNHTGSIAHTVASSDSNYNAIVAAGVTVHITDNDSAGVTTTETGGTHVVEGGATDSYTVVLTSEPTASVTVTIATDGKTTVNPTSLTFTSGNWDQTQTVTVTAVDDAVAEGSHTSTITHTANSADTNYDAIAVAGVTAYITDNDTATANFTLAAQSGNEDAGNMTITVQLSMLSAHDVTVPFTVGGTATNPTDYTITASPVTIPAGSLTATITVTVNADATHESDETVVVTMGTPTNAAKGTVNVHTATIRNDDAPGILINESGNATNVTEGGGTDTYTIVMLSQPTANTTITIATDGHTTVNSTSLTFTTGNWNVPQTVIVTADDDHVAEGLHTSTISHTASSSDTDYNGVTINDVTANITDNDTAGITITESSGSTRVVEGGATDSYDVVLTSQPTANVVITITPDAATTVNHSSLTFTSSNWSVPQTVVVTATNDHVAQGDHSSVITHSVASSDSTYNAFTVANVSVDVTDNDVAGVTIDDIDGSIDVAEGGATDSYTIVLQSQPTANVTITVDPDNQTSVGAGAGNVISLTFSAANWNTPQTVPVTAVDDHYVEGLHTSTIAHTTISADSNYSGASVAGVTAHITDNDTAGVTITESGGATNVVEGGASDTYDVVLTSQPTANVTVTISTDAQTTVNLTSLTFTNGNWNIPQTVMVTAVDDAVAEGNHTGTITHATTSADTHYNGLTVASVSVHITDNDSAGVAVVETNGSTIITENGSTDTYTVALTSRPTANVVVTATPAARLDLGAGVGQAVQLTFTPADWNTPQSLTIAEVNDNVAEGTRYQTIAHAAASTDPNYNALTVNTLTVLIYDDDAPLGGGGGGNNGNSTHPQQPSDGTDTPTNPPPDGNNPDTGGDNTDDHGQAPTFAIQTEPAEGGTVEVTQVAAACDQGTAYNLTAHPREGYVFDGWGGDLTGNTNPAAICASGDVRITARFAQVSGWPQEEQIVITTTTHYGLCGSVGVISLGMTALGMLLMRKNTGVACCSSRNRVRRSRILP